MTSENIKSWGAKRTYSNAYLTSEYDGDCIGQEIIRQMLNLMSFESIQNFNNIMGEFNEGNIPKSIQNQIKNLFNNQAFPQKHMTWGNNGLIESIEIPEGIDESLNNPIIIENPFVIGKNIIEPNIEIYSMSVELAAYPCIYINAAVSCEYICEARNNDLNDICSILVKDDISKENLSSAELSVIKNYLIEQKVNPNLVEDNEFFLSELSFQIKCVIENLGITTKEFLIDNDSIFFFPEGEEKLSFL